MLFSELLAVSKVDSNAKIGDAEVSGIEDDSRRVTKDSLFVCMPSENTDSHQYLESAWTRGARSAIVHSAKGFSLAQTIGFACLQLSNRLDLYNLSLGNLCRTFYGDPSAKMRVTGITGTNGKTTTAWMITNGLQVLGRRSAYLGTLGFQCGSNLQELENTTPFPVLLYQLLTEAVRSGVEDFVMEVSSHALSQNRLSGVKFEVGTFTNLSQDHLDFHKTMEEYEHAKRSFFSCLGPGSNENFRSAVNVDDETGCKLANELEGKVLTYGFNTGEVRGTVLNVTAESVTLNVSHGADTFTIVGKSGGEFNAANYLAAFSTLVLLDVPGMEAAEALSEVSPVRGRFEPIANERGIGIVVDYAHTPDALEKLLSSARELTSSRLIVVFGCGGDRDRTKRPKMAKAASRFADLVVVTSDNPRTEDPEAIVDEVCSGLSPNVQSLRITDRRAAIYKAIESAESGDIVVIAGKGHEDYQIIGRTKFAMDDRQMAKEALASLAMSSR